MAVFPSPSPATAVKNPFKAIARTPFLPSLRRHTRLDMSAPPPRLTVASSASLLSVDTCHREDVIATARAALSSCLSETHLDLTVPGLDAKARGKVRDVYEGRGYMVLVTTDRQSAFDRVLASIPFKGQVLNETSIWWFNKTQTIVPNAVVCSPDRNVTVAKKCSVFPVEFVVRGFVTGSTNTSLWAVYNNGTRNYCGNALPDGMIKNQKLPANIVTPTTKAVDHDVPVSPDEIVKMGLMTKEEYLEVSSKALSLFAYGQQTAMNRGLLLADTKYEFGKDADGTIMLIDEVHTPDSSRYWISNSYEERFNARLEPENVDKEFLRLWFKDHCNPYEDQVLPDAPEELVCELAWRYIFLYETMTNSKFQITTTEESIHERISRNVYEVLKSLENHVCKNTGRSRGFGFIHFFIEHEAKCAKNAMDGKALLGRPLKISFAFDKIRGAPVVVPRVSSVGYSSS